MNERRPQIGAAFREGLGEKSRPPTYALATEIHRAIDLSCRAGDACAALALGAGLGFPVGDSAPLRIHPQTSDLSKWIAGSLQSRM